MRCSTERPIRAVVLTVIACAVMTLVAGARQSDRPRSREFRPEDLGTLEPPDRDEWQQPDKIMDALGIYDGNRVGDVGAGSGWFTIRLARRVGPNGRVYAEDIKPLMLESIKNAAERAGLNNIRFKLGTEFDPRLPSDLNAVLMVGVYGFLKDPVAILTNVAKSLAPSGRLGIVEYKKDGAGGPGPDIEERIDPEVIIRDAGSAGLALRSHETFLRYQYLLVLSRKQAGFNLPDPAEAISGARAASTPAAEAWRPRQLSSRRAR